MKRQKCSENFWEEDNCGLKSVAEHLETPDRLHTMLKRAIEKGHKKKVTAFVAQGRNVLGRTVSAPAPASPMVNTDTFCTRHKCREAVREIN